MDDRRRNSDHDDIEAALREAGRRLHDDGPSPDDTDAAFRGVLWVTSLDSERAHRAGSITEVPLDDVPRIPRRRARSPRWIPLAGAAAAAVLAAFVVIPTIAGDDDGGDESGTDGLSTEHSTGETRRPVDPALEPPTGDRSTMTYTVTDGEAGSPSACLTFWSPDDSHATGCFGPTAPLASGRTIVADTGDDVGIWQVVTWNDDAGMLTIDEYSDEILVECSDVIDSAIAESGVALVDCPFGNAFRFARVVPSSSGVGSVYASTADHHTVRVIPVGASEATTPALRLGRLPGGDDRRCIVVDAPLEHRWTEACGTYDAPGTLAAIIDDDELYVVQYGADLGSYELLQPTDPSAAPYGCEGQLTEVLAPLERLGAMVSGISCAGDVAIVSTAPVALSDGPPSEMWHELRRTSHGTWTIGRSGIPADCTQVGELCTQFQRGVDPFADARPITA